MERLTKLIVVVSLAAAMWSQLAAAAGKWSAFHGAVAAGFAVFVLGAASGRLWPAVARRMTLFAAYLVPGLFILLRGDFIDAQWLLWAGVLLGVILSTPARFAWSLPRRWRLPLVYWAVIVACAWPIVAWREANFDLTSVSALARGPTGLVAAWTLIGILWFDWLCAEYSSAADDAYEADILFPLAAGWVVAVAMGLTQMFGSLTFLNPPPWSTWHRASGPLAEANIFGVLSALWGPALVAIVATRSTRRTLPLISAVVLSLSWLSVWGSGSRSSLLLAAVGFGGVLAGIWRFTRSTRTVCVAAGSSLAVVALGGWLVARGGASTASPAARFVHDFMPQWSSAWAAGMAAHLWTRGGYGNVAGAMFRQSPWVGVGVGAFHDLVHLYAWRLFRVDLAPDNAQNWFRHELTELGLVGSIGWAVWAMVFLIRLVTARDRSGRQITATTVRALVIGVGLISLVGMPAQHIAMIVTFWTFAFWFTRETAARETPIHTAPAPPSSSRPWVMLWLLVIAYMAGTAYTGWTALGPPVRAQWAQVDYSDGVYMPADFDGFHWTRQRASIVVPASRPWLAFTIAVNHVDVEQHPVDVKVWIDRRLSWTTRLGTPRPLTQYFRVADAEPRVMVETWVSRIVRPRDSGGSDSRELGLLVRWTFVEAPPPGTYEGYHDVTNCNGISGWAWDPDRPGTPLAIDVYDGAALLASVLANQFRQDLLAASKGDGRHGFVLPTPARLKDGKTHVISMKYAGTTTLLMNGPKEITCGDRP